MGPGRGLDIEDGEKRGVSVWGFRIGRIKQQRTFSPIDPVK